MADNTPERGERWAGRIRPGHPAFTAIQAAIRGYQPTNRVQLAPTTRDIGEATGIPAGTLSRYMRHLAEGGHVVSRKTDGVRGHTWLWIGDATPLPSQTPADASAGAGADVTPIDAETAASVDHSGLAVRVQLAPAIDNPEGHGKRPYPFVVGRYGAIGAQHFWKGRPLSAIGFTSDLARQRIDLWWDDYVSARDWTAAVGKYLVTENAEGRWATQLTAVESVMVVADRAVSDAA